MHLILPGTLASDTLGGTDGGLDLVATTSSLPPKWNFPTAGLTPLDVEGRRLVEDIWNNEFVCTYCCKNHKCIDFVCTVTYSISQQTSCQ